MNSETKAGVGLRRDIERREKGIDPPDVEKNKRTSERRINLHLRGNSARRPTSALRSRAAQRDSSTRAFGAVRTQ